MIQIRIRTEQAVAGLSRLSSGIQSGGQRGLERAAQDGFNDSQRLVHVKTGQLKRSGGIKERRPDRVTYGYDAPYAGFEEFGTSRGRPAHPFVTPRYNILGNGLAADYIFQELSRTF